MAKPKVLITGVGGRSVGFQILSALQMLDTKRYQIIVCDADETAFGLYFADRRYRVPLASSPDYLSSIISIIKKEKVDIVIPGTEIELRFLAKHRGSLGALLLSSDTEILEKCLDKKKASEWMLQNSISYPDTAGIGEWEKLVERCGFPIVAKPTDITGGSRDVKILADAAETIDYISCFPRETDNLIFQQYIGSPETEYTVGILSDHKGVVVDSIVLKRILTGLSLGTERFIDGKRFALSSGYSQGVIIKDKKISEFCEDIAVKLGICGPLNIQLRVDTDGTLKVFELHPRFSGTTSIRAQAGFNEVDLAIRSFLNKETFGRQSYQTNVYAVRALQNALIPLSLLSDIASETS